MLTKLIKIALYIAIFMTAAGLGTYFTVHLMIRNEHGVVVPDLVGREVVYALELLTDLGLNTKVKEFEFSQSVPKHHVVSQDPEPGREIKQGRDVRLVISKGNPTVVYPNVTESDLPMAGILITENDLKPGLLTYTHSPKSRDAILAQFPPAGETGIRGDTVDLLVSAVPAPERMRMVDLSGIGLDNAVSMIEKIQLELGIITTADRADLPNETVIDHTPPQGYPVVPGSAVNLTINRHANRKISPRVIGSTLFRYRAPQGFLRQQVRVRISRAKLAYDILDRFVKPREEIWLLILRDEPTTLFLYLDGELNMTQHYE